MHLYKLKAKEIAYIQDCYMPRFPDLSANYTKTAIMHAHKSMAIVVYVQH